MGSYSLDFLEKNTSKEILKTSKPKNSTNISASLYLGAKRKDDKDFEPSSLIGLFSSFDRHLKKCKYPVSVVEDVTLERERKCIEAKNEQLTKEGKGNRSNTAETLCDDENNILYEKNLRGISNGEALINTLCLFNSLNFGLR